MTPVASITETLTSAVADHGVAAVFVLMAVDALLPAGGELIMVVAGAIAAGTIAGTPTLLGHQIGTGLPTYLALALSGTMGYLAGSWGGWALGRHGGRELIERHGRLVHLGPERVAQAEKWFTRHGGHAVFLGRLVPLVRSFISIPAGMFGEPLGRYLLLTGLGSAIWCFGFAAIGWALGSSYKSVDRAAHGVEVVVVLAAIAAAVTWSRRARAGPSGPPR